MIDYLIVAGGAIWIYNKYYSNTIGSSQNDITSEDVYNATELPVEEKLTKGEKFRLSPYIKKCKKEMLKYKKLGDTTYKVASPKYSRNFDDAVVKQLQKEGFVLDSGCRYTFSLVKNKE